MGVRTADCLPLLLAEPSRGVVAAVHAGWRGTLAGVVAAALAALERTFGCRPHRLLAALGPCIRPCCYRVGEEVYQAFLERFGPQAALSGTKGMAVDLAQANRMELLCHGVPAGNIETLDFCTCCSEDSLLSYRREGEACGHQLAYICPGE